MQINDLYEVVRQEGDEAKATEGKVLTSVVGALKYGHCSGPRLS